MTDKNKHNTVLLRINEDIIINNLTFEEQKYVRDLDKHKSLLNGIVTLFTSDFINLLSSTNLFYYYHGFDEKIDNIINVISMSYPYLSYKDLFIIHPDIFNNVLKCSDLLHYNNDSIDYIFNDNYINYIYTNIQDFKDPEYSTDIYDLIDFISYNHLSCVKLICSFIDIILQRKNKSYLDLYINPVICSFNLSKDTYSKKELIDITLFWQ